MQGSVVWVHRRVDVITWTKSIQYCLVVYRVIRCPLSLITWDIDVFDPRRVMCDVETLDFSQELDASFYAVLFSDHQTTQAANGD